jgi:hypothetical protein
MYGESKFLSLIEPWIENNAFNEPLQVCFSFFSRCLRPSSKNPAILRSIYIMKGLTTQFNLPFCLACYPRQMSPARSVLRIEFRGIESTRKKETRRVGRVMGRTEQELDRCKQETERIQRSKRDCEPAAMPMHQKLAMFGSRLERYWKNLGT